ncbi:Hpt domain-containing protein [Pseudomonas sp. DTU_2021_1001937_2_SI_NGA_ILE_001]|uniref:Hpt domain-containing protein n=1 Tax=Pseudomonas sp. DTU_2021_1001937_2_SI_NGA_ILE_001 TaxID=3077589 RepID=UPI0028FC27D6|nr:Hpt domain-containing protein [Pseudomonas sp. DTU_2021_1001937_2_SI_NGA_ILE_001]WNW14244.1 Hpt domain-containing protein [Pseudomonas sp. DTU_2021_1001937_2_SI_NGA_ILE_001]
MEDEYLTLIDVFLKDSDLRMALFRQASRTMTFDRPSLNMGELGLAAHSFKGSSSNMGAVLLSELCLRLEEQARREQPEGLEQLIALIDEEYQSIRQLFEAERQTLMAQT